MLKITKYTVGEAPVVVYADPVWDYESANYTNVKKKISDKYTNGTFVATDGFGKIVDIFVLSKEPNKNEPIWLSEYDIPDFLGNDICEKFKKWNEFRKQGIIWYNKNK